MFGYPSAEAFRSLQFPLLFGNKRDPARRNTAKLQGQRANLGEKNDESADRVLVPSCGRILAGRLRKRACCERGHRCRLRRHADNGGNGSASRERGSGRGSTRLGFRRELCVAGAVPM